MIWMAAESNIANDPRILPEMLAGGTNAPAQLQFTRKAFHRIADTRDPQKLDQAMALLGSNKLNPALASAAIDGLLDVKTTHATCDKSRRDSGQAPAGQRQSPRRSRHAPRRRVGQCQSRIRSLKGHQPIPRPPNPTGSAPSAPPATSKPTMPDQRSFPH